MHYTSALLFYFGNVTFRLNGAEKAKVFAPSIQAVS
jgi:hypothetical protein